MSETLTITDNRTGRQYELPITDEPHCPGAKKPSIEFQDKCALAGFRMIQCACDTLCTGNVSAPKQAYDSKNVVKACAPAKEDCSPPDTSVLKHPAVRERLIIRSRRVSRVF